MIRSIICLTGCLALSHGSIQAAPQFTGIQRLANGEVQFELNAAQGARHRIEVSPDGISWQPFRTFQGAGRQPHTDAASLYLPSRFYRAVQLQGTSDLTGDHLPTEDGDVVIHPIDHASFVMEWNGKWIYNDPVGGAGLYQGLPRADLMLVSHTHGDHFNASTLDAVKGTSPILIVPAAVYTSLSSALRSFAVPLANGESTNVLGLKVEAVPAYNSRHPKGVGNGYVLTVGGRRLYMSGDTEDVAEMRALPNIDVAFLCMNVPFTMTVNQAASAVREFRPRIVYPYHFRNQDSTFADLNAFRRLVGTDLGIEVRVRSWY